MNKQIYYQYQPPVAMFSMAQFNMFDWVGNRFIDWGEGRNQKFKTSPEYQTNPSYRQSVDQMFDDTKGLRPHAKALGKGIVGLGVAGLATAGAGIYFMRRRQTKNGKVVVERVRR